MKKIITLLITHVFVGIIGFALGIYALPILIAPPAPTEAMVEQLSSHANYQGQFRKDLADSDSLHWGEGTVSITNDNIALQGTIAPGPDYKLYLSPEFVETEADFERIKNSMALVGDVKTFNNFVVSVPPSIKPEQYSTVIVWCESFSEFITAAKYQ